MNDIDGSPPKDRSLAWRLTASLATIAGATAAVIVALALIGGQTSAGGDQSPSASPSPSASLSPTVRPSTSPRPSGEPPAPSGSPTAWTRAATFGGPGTTSEVRDIAAWSGGFIAIGSQWPGGTLISPAEPMVWISTDGTHWSDGTVLADATDIRLTSVATLPDGRLIVTGDVGVTAAATEADAPAPSTGTWVSSDAERWEPLDVPFGDDELMTVAAGAEGYIAAGGREIWFSTDGAAWELVHEVQAGDFVIDPVAGDEGFVATGDAASGGGSFVLASGDGTTWFERTATPVTGIAPIGGDWLGVMPTSSEPFTINLVRSSNGLDWSPVLDVNSLTPPDGPKAGRGLDDGTPIHHAPISSVDGLLVMSFAWTHCCAQLDMGTLTVASSDGESWAQIDLGDAPLVQAAAADDEVIVLVGQAQRGAEGAIWVRRR